VLRDARRRDEVSPLGMALQEPACPDRWWELFRCGELIGSGRMRRGVQENARCLSSYGKVSERHYANGKCHGHLGSPNMTTVKGFRSRTSSYP